MLRKLPFFLPVLLIVHNSFAQKGFDKVVKADSLFEQHKYTESFQLYQEALENDHVTSPAMLLKMAFIKEGLSDYSNALYYLNLYYLQTHNKRALRKMEEIAQEYSLFGYNYTDKEFFLNFFYRYYYKIVMGVVAITMLIFAYLVYKKRKLRVKPGMSVINLVIAIILLFFMVNFGRSYRAGIITEQNAYLMKGPSSGADVKEIVNKGHRVRILGHEDVWVKIRWMDDIAYIRETQIREIGL
jgi:hypothetical protein